MIGIAYIDSSNMKTFSERLELFMNEHPEVKILFISKKGVEGGKGVFAILSYDKKEEPKPIPINDTLAKARAAKAKKEAEEKAKKEAEEKARKEAELEAKRAELLAKKAESERALAELGE